MKRFAIVLALVASAPGISRAENTSTPPQQYAAVNLRLRDAPPAPATQAEVARQNAVPVNDEAAAKRRRIYIGVGVAAGVAVVAGIVAGVVVATKAPSTPDGAAAVFHLGN